MGFLGSLVLSFLLDILILSDILGCSTLLGGEGSLSLLDLANSFFSEGLFVLRTSTLDLLDVIESDSFNSSLLSEDFLLFVFAEVSLLEFLVESSPSGGPSESLGLEFSELFLVYLREKSLVLLLRKRKGLPSLATNLIPRPG